MKYKIPFVLLDRQIEGIQSDVVLGDNYESIRHLIQHLVEQGHSRIALINGLLSISNFRDRHQAYLNSLKIYDLPVDQDLIFHTPLIQIETDEIVNRLLSLPSGKNPTAILATNNFLGVHTIQSLRKHHMEIPQDMAVVSFDDPEAVPDFNPFLTVAAQPAYSFGFMGMQMLIERIEGIAPAEFRKIVLPSKLIIRSSSVK